MSNQILKFILICVASLFFTAEVQAYTPPIGIPDPGMWGSTHPIDSVAPATSEKCPAWPAAATVGCYYVDNTHLSAIDTGNAYGYPDKPRKTIPTNYAAGSYVELHGGPYTGSQLIITASGTPSDPVWIRGDGYDNRPIISRETILKGSYIFMENIVFSGTNKPSLGLRPHNGSLVDHVTVRYCDFIGTGVNVGNATAVAMYGSAIRRNNSFVIYKNNFNRLGDVSPVASENDFHAVKPSTNVDDVWILENQGSYLSGDFVQVGDASIADETRPNKIYIGKNVSYGNKENGADIKEANNVVISSEEYHDHQANAIVIHNGSSQVWVLNNKIYNLVSGIGITSGNGVYVFGNLIYNIHTKEASYDTNSIWTDGCAIKAYSTTNVQIENNTIWDYDKGVLLGSTNSNPSYLMHNNLFGNRSYASAHDIIFDNSVIFANIDLDYNGFYSAQNPFSVNVGGTLYASLDSLQAAGKCINCQTESINPIIDYNSKLFGLNANARAVDAGKNPDIRALFFENFGFSLAGDIDTITRPQGAAWDIGAFEYKPAVQIPIADTTPPSAPSGVSVE